MSKSPSTYATWRRTNSLSTFFNVKTHFVFYCYLLCRLARFAIDWHKRYHAVRYFSIVCFQWSLELKRLIMTIASSTAICVNREYTSKLANLSVSIYYLLLTFILIVAVFCLKSKITKNKYSNTDSTTLWNHKSQTGHRFNFDSGGILHKESHQKKREIKEINYIHVEKT